MNHSQMYWLHAITPLHVGAGRGAGVIDLPVVREKATQWPYVPGSGVKGVVADAHGASIRGSDGDSPRKDDWHAAAFGRPAGKAVDADNAGSLVFTDARIVCLPVRSLVGTFAWATCPLVLQRLKQDAGLAGNAALADLAVPEVEIDEAAVASIDTRTLVHRVQDTDKLYLEDLDLDAVDGDKTKAWAEQLGMQLFAAQQDRTAFGQRFVIVHNDLFNFLCETALEVRARIKLDPDTKTTQSGALWYEESLPTETILSGTVWCDKVFGNGAAAAGITQQTLLDKYCKGDAHFQMGGKASTGKGLVHAIGLSAAGAI
ncbi:MAG: type III-B CRISPR module RAMP protein Cmr4 [Rhodoferax sp.]|uniref:type III-B CRISPR module RAMP protein Cmr4 n=1 Tax=Rhodoferax sp. TaxID=50421 RepID=UPI0026365D4C|nr:type III-B CRISPR module RAMP protein Cmr4 [Rhodoferax sp.]MDD5333029.1 type III-B CRISPR module RAMP protein Cmr4 [Rhodoferax sp.]